MLLVEVQQELPRKPSFPMSLHDVRLSLNMTQDELSFASHTILGRHQLKGVAAITIFRAEAGEPIKELTARKILTTINEIYTGRGRYPLGINDITWNISDRKPHKRTKRET